MDPLSVGIVGGGQSREWGRGRDNEYRQDRSCDGRSVAVLAAVRPIGPGPDAGRSRAGAAPGPPAAAAARLCVALRDHAHGPLGRISSGIAANARRHELRAARYRFSRGPDAGRARCADRGDPRRHPHRTGGFGACSRTRTSSVRGSGIESAPASGALPLRCQVIERETVPRGLTQPLSVRLSCRWSCRRSGSSGASWPRGSRAPDRRAGVRSRGSRP